jgi:hypothetical protein
VRVRDHHVVVAVVWVTLVPRITLGSKLDPSGDRRGSVPLVGIERHACQDERQRERRNPASLRRVPVEPVAMVVDAMSGMVTHVR